MKKFVFLFSLAAVSIAFATANLLDRLSATSNFANANLKSDSQLQDENKLNAESVTTTSTPSPTKPTTAVKGEVSSTTKNSVLKGSNLKGYVDVYNYDYGFNSYSYCDPYDPYCDSYGYDSICDPYYPYCDYYSYDTYYCDPYYDPYCDSYGYGYGNIYSKK